MASLAAGCGDDGEADSSPSAATIPEPSGTLRLAVRGGIETLDPLLADDRAERLASRQIHEPLLSSQAGPFGQARQRPGLARRFTPSAGATIWTATLRRGVRFQNGEPLDADAVRANVERWLAVAPELVPGLDAVDSPQPGIVRFLLDGPSPRFAKVLASGRLGLISPQALAEAGGSPLSAAATRTGTGPFELREREAGRALLARNAAWWGTPLGLGPGLDQLEILDVQLGAERVELLEAGSVEVAAGLSPALARSVADSPLLTVVRGGGQALGIERSVRGIESAEVEQPLADAWLTDVR